MTKRATFFRTTGLMTLAVAALISSLTTGCRRESYSEKPPIHINPNMDNQEKFISQSENTFFADQSSMREPVPGTVARGWLRADGDTPLVVSMTGTGMLLTSDDAQTAGSSVASEQVVTIPASERVAFYTGKVAEGEDADFVERGPIPRTRLILQRGQERYNIYCTPCHGYTGDGESEVVRKGMLRPTSYHDARIRAMPDGQIFDIISNGVNNRNMPGYSHQIPVADRWAIVAYVRALQQSAHASAADVPGNEREALDNQ